MTRTFEQQIFDLEIAMPPNLVSRALSRATVAQAPRPRWKNSKALAGLAVGTVFVGANVAAAQYVPPYRTLVDKLPLGESSEVARIRDESGIHATDVVPQTASAKVGEFLVEVVETYADDYRTTVLLRPSYVGGLGPSKELPLYRRTVHLEDSSGRVYLMQGGVGDSSISVDFEPLVDLAAAEGPVSLVISNLEVDLGAEYRGSWAIELAFEQKEARSLPLPPSPLVAGDTQYAIKSVIDSGFRLVIEWEATGGGAGRLAEFLSANPPGSWHGDPEFDHLVHINDRLRFSLWPQVFDTNGRPIWGSRAFDGQIANGVYYGRQEIELPAPGEYSIRFGEFTEAGEYDFTSADPGWPITID
jgi:hypothetical protein